jgi:hypothetical protein
MFEGKIYECNGTNGRQGVAIMVSNVFNNFKIF